MANLAKIISVALVALLFAPTPAQAAGSSLGSTGYIPCKFALIAGKGTNAVIAYSTLQVTVDPDTLDETMADKIVVKNVSSKGAITSTRTISLLPTERLANSDNCIGVVATSGYYYIAASLINEVQDDPACVEDFDVDPPVTCSVTVTEYLQFWRSTNGTTWARTGRLSTPGASDVRVSATAAVVIVATGTPMVDPACVPGSLDEYGYPIECEADRMRLDVYESSSASMAFRSPVVITSDAEISDGYMSAELSGGGVGILSWKNVDGEYIASARKGVRSWSTTTKIATETFVYAGTSASTGKSALIAFVDSSSSKLSWRMSTNSGVTWASQKRSSALVTGEVYQRNVWTVGSKFYVAVDRVPWDGDYYSSVYQVSTSSAVRKFTVGVNESISGAVALGTRSIVVSRYQIGQTYYLRLYSFI